MKKRIRRSSLIARKRHGFRSKPRSAMPRGTKAKNVKRALNARRRRQKAAAA